MTFYYLHDKTRVGQVGGALVFPRLIIEKAEIDQESLMVPESLRLILEGGFTLRIFDDGQSCCERRWISTDDDIQSLVGHTLLRVDLKKAPDGGENEYGGRREICFVEIGTDAGFITLASHNEHNGHYGGFALKVEVTQSLDNLT